MADMNEFEVECRHGGIHIATFNLSLPISNEGITKEDEASLIKAAKASLVINNIEGPPFEGITFSIRQSASI